MGAIILKQNFYIKKRKPEAERSRVLNRSDGIDQCHVDAIACVVRRSMACELEPKLSYAYSCPTAERSVRFVHYAVPPYRPCGVHKYVDTRLPQQEWVALREKSFPH